MSIGKLKSMFPDITEKDFDYVLWEWTAYPMGGAKTIVKQFRSKVRSVTNNRKICWFCACDIEIFGHKHYCPDKIIS
jgi:hypothetical protein